MKLSLRNYILKIVYYILNKNWDNEKEKNKAWNWEKQTFWMINAQQIFFEKWLCDWHLK